MPSVGFIQTLGSAAGASPATTVAVTVSANATAGNTLIIVVKGSTSLVASSATDSRGNTYVVDVSNAASVNTTSIMRGYMAAPVQNGDTITVTMTGSGNIPSIEVYEYSGMYKLATALALEKTSGAGGTGVTTVTAPAIVTTDPTDILICGFTTNVSTISAVSTPASFTARGTILTASGLYLRLMDRNPAVAGSYSAAWSWTTAANASVVLAAYMAQAPYPNNYQGFRVGDGMSVGEKIR